MTDLWSSGASDDARLARFATMIDTLCSPADLAATDQALLADPGFSSLYRTGRPGLDEATLAECPPGTLGGEYLRFLAHYRLPRRFFTASTGARPCEFAASRLAEIHDFVHVLGEYETSDDDEVAIQSFFAGQAPVVLALFLRDALGAPTAGGDAYVHLRQLPARALSPIDVARGRAARPLLGFAFELELRTPVSALRERLALRPRSSALASSHGNSCSGAAVGPYFLRHGGRGA